jgi:hypothetical protein
MMSIFRWKHYPLSYIQNSNKEKLLLWYTENFRRQYHFVYKARKPLFLAAENECGLQVTSSCSFLSLDFYGWSSMCNLVSANSALQGEDGNCTVCQNVG